MVTWVSQVKLIKLGKVKLTISKLGKVKLSKLISKKATWLVCPFRLHPFVRVCRRYMRASIAWYGSRIAIMKCRYGIPEITSWRRGDTAIRGRIQSGGGGRSYRSRGRIWGHSIGTRLLRPLIWKVVAVGIGTTHPLVWWYRIDPFTG